MEIKSKLQIKNAIKNTYYNKVYKTAMSDFQNFGFFKLKYQRYILFLKDCDKIQNFIN